MTSPGQQDVNQRANGPERPSGEAVLPAAPAAAVTAETILQGYKNLGDGAFEMTLPVGVTIHEAGEILNRAAKDKGIKPVFYEGQKDFWEKNEAHRERDYWETNQAIQEGNYLRTMPGQTYLFKIPTDSVPKIKSEQESDHGELDFRSVRSFGAPLGIVSLAGACERYNTNNKGTLDAYGDQVWLRCSAPDIAICLYGDSGVSVGRLEDDRRAGWVAFAFLVSAMSPEISNRNTGTDLAGSLLPAAPAAAVTAETILQGYKKLAGGVIEMTLPVGVTIHEAGEILNRAAREKGIEIPVFYEGQKDFWLTNEANKDFRTEPGQACRFKIPTDSLSKTKAEQESDYGAAAPLGIVSLAEACERYNTNNKGTLFKDASGAKVWARGSAPGFALDSFSDLGVYVYGDSDGSRDADVAFASLVSARN